MKIEEAIQQRVFKSPQQKALLNLMYTAAWFTGVREALFKDFDITPQQFNVLRILRGRHPQLLCTGKIKTVMIDKNPDLTRLDWLALPDAVPAPLTLAAPLRPDGCLDAVTGRIEAALAGKTVQPYQTRSQRGAYMYDQITNWLTALYRHADRPAQVIAIVEFLFEQYPTLHLLKRALRGARLTEDAAVRPAAADGEAEDAAPRRRGRPPKEKR